MRSFFINAVRMAVPRHGGVIGCVMTARVALVLGVGLIRSQAGAYHRTPLDKPADTNASPAFTASTNTALKRISDTLYELGRVRIDTQRKTLAFPATVNMAEGAVEYALVHSTGKVHESVLKTEVGATEIHVARLLIGPPVPAPDPKMPPDLQGCPVDVWLRWRQVETERRVRMEDLISNTITKREMTRGPWIYNGSRVVEGTFLAQRDGSILAIIADPDALLNNPRPGRDDDEIWKVNSALTPPAGAPVEVVMEFPQANKK